MQVSEIFYSLQGEGTNIGIPSIFLRTQGCHLRCVWCDSKFTWDFKGGKKLTSEEIIKKIQKFPGKNLVITGGEPLIQQSAIKELLQKLPEKYFVEMETSGSLKSILDDYIDQYNCSPKLSNSLPAGHTFSAVPAGRQGQSRHGKNKILKLEKFPPEKTFYKFVVESPKDLKEIKALIKTHQLPHDKIILIPQGITTHELAKRSLWLSKICKKENYRFSPRLHINLWGNKRSV